MAIRPGSHRDLHPVELHVFGTDQLHGLAVRERLAVNGEAGKLDIKIVYNACGAIAKLNGP